MDELKLLHTLLSDPILKDVFPDISNSPQALPTKTHSKCAGSIQWPLSERDFRLQEGTRRISTLKVQRGDGSEFSTLLPMYLIASCLCPNKLLHWFSEEMHLANSIL